MAEVELKLRLAPAEAARLRRSPLLRGMGGGRPVTRHLRSVYYDTPDHALRRHDMALRVREDGRRRVQTLKVPSGPSNGLQIHREIECPVDGARPDLSRIEDEALQAFFAANGGAGALAPVFETAVERVLRHVRLGDSAIEVAIDVGCLRANGGERPICEAELELRHGRPARLFELALDLQDEVPLAIEARTKAARGYALAAREEAGWVKARPVPLERDLGAAEAFALIAHGCLDQIRDNHPGVVEARDPEAVHQMRIGVRRMRALVGAFRPYIAAPALDFMAAELHWLQQALGPARDWHVFTQEMVEPACRRLPLEPGLQRLLELARGIEARAMEEGCRAVETARFTTLLLRLGLMLHDEAWIAPGAAGAAAREECIGVLAGRLLERRYRKLRRFGGRDAALDAPELHRLRIQAKKMRYLSEFFRPLYPRKAAKSFIGHLAELQEILGAVQDAVVGRDRLAAIEAEAGAVGEAERLALARAGGIVTGWLESRTAASLDRLRDTWKRFRRGPVFWAAE